MKKLQNNFTTPEQSKRMLDIGVPADSADMKYPIIPCCNGSAVLATDIVVSCKELGDGEIPCWSVGRLIEIYCLCSCVSVPYIYYNIDVTHIDIDNDTFINQIINNIKESIEEDDFDLSKLED